MLQVDQKPDPHFTQPVRQILMMLVFVVIVAIGAFLSYQSLLPIFMANMYLWLHHACVRIWRISVFLAGFYAGKLSQLDRRLRA